MGAKTERPTRWWRSLWLVGVPALVIVLVAAGVGWWLTSRDAGRDAHLTAVGQRNLTAFHSSALADFARPWLDDANACHAVEDRFDLRRYAAKEYVICYTAATTTVSFYRYADTSSRDHAIGLRAQAMPGIRQVSRTTVDGTPTGTRIIWSVPNAPSEQPTDVSLLYWDRTDSPVSGELDPPAGGGTPSRDQLITMWQRHR